VVHFEVEFTDIAASHPEIVEDFRRDHKEWEKKLTDPLWPGVMDFRFQIGDEVYYFAL